MSPEFSGTAQPTQDVAHESNGFDLLREALLLERRVRDGIGLEQLQGNKGFKRRLVREISIGLVLGSGELDIEVPAINTAERFEDGEPAIAGADWSEEKGGEMTFIRKHLRKFVTGIYRDHPLYFVVLHEAYHIRQLMDDYARVRADLKSKDWEKTETEKAANSFGNLIVLRYGSDIQLAFQGLPSPS